MFVAASTGSTEALKKLLDTTSHLNAQAEDGKTALMETCLWGQSEAAQMLLRVGASVSLADDDGRTALLYASFWDTAR